MRIVIAAMVLLLVACGSEGNGSSWLEGPLLPDPEGAARDNFEEPEPPPPLEEEALDPLPEPTDEELRAYVEARVREGFSGRDAILEDVVAIYEGERSLRTQATVLVDAALAAQRQREATWTEATDCDRLTRAFAVLDAAGVIAREKWSDCGTCGAGEMQSEMETLAERGRRVRGYTFFHDQDVEGLTDTDDGGTLYLSYGALDGDADAAVAIGREVERVLRFHGLSTRWDGSLEQRIAIVDLEWRRRRFTEAPLIPPPPERARSGGTSSADD